LRIICFYNNYKHLSQNFLNIITQRSNSRTARNIILCFSPYFSFRKFISPYAKTAIKNTDRKQICRQPLFGPNIHLQSTVISRRSGLQDCSTHQTKSVQNSDRISDLGSYKSNSTNNFCLISLSKRNRPVSAPAGQLRCTQFSSSRLQLAQKESEVPQVIKCQPRVIKVTAYKNGTRSIFAKIAVPSIKLLLEECTEKLNLNMAARRVFLADGTEALEPKDIPHDADIYISIGEPFLDPFKKIKGKKTNSIWLQGLEQVADVPCLLRKERVGELGHRVTYCVSIKRAALG
uniref:Doublecortin domain-containing protein n=1 Tax=Chrysemys picta bellii TaxID=8478 RepID=A0A8C3HCD3_CHRPI